VLIEEGGVNPEEQAVQRNELAVCLIGLGRFREAMQAISSTRPSPDDVRGIRELFNYAMAEWGDSGSVPQDLLARVVALHADGGPMQMDANYLQGLAMAQWLVGNQEAARDLVARARQRMMSRPTADFSAWRYLMVPPDVFRLDLDEMLEAFSEKGPGPRFLRADRTALAQGGDT
jgi:hypothetical protein